MSLRLYALSRAGAVSASPYRGRFAPSPTGALHLGSLCTAVASWLDARAAGGTWCLRIEDIDPPREVPGADAAILHCLEAHDLGWDGPVLFQSQRSEAYAAALDHLRRAGLTYPCDCTRRALRAQGGPYPGTCRGRTTPSPGAHAIRFRVPDGPLCFEDRLHSHQCENLPTTSGDFILKRRDGLWAYQLAVVVDDAAQGITDIVRGEDLLSSTVRQIALQKALAYPTPRYLHMPLVVDAAGQKWAKQTGAPALDNAQARSNLHRALTLLGLQSDPQDPCHRQLDDGCRQWPAVALRKGALALEETLG